MLRPTLEIADIFRDHGPAWRAANAGHISPDQLKVMSAIEACRTAGLGGTVVRCDDCQHTQIQYRSCRNRHCPKCQGSAARDWLAEREAELLPVPYHHVVFTLPAAIAKIAWPNKEAKVALQRATTALATATVELAEAKNNLAEATGEREKAKAKVQKDIADQRAKNIEQRLELTHQLDKLSDRFERLLVRAPVDGFVNDVLPKGAGFVMQPGQLIAEIVPKEQRLIAEVRIQPRDVGHIKNGDPAELEVTTYDVNVHGKIKGKVTNISASSFNSETGEPYFRGEISFDLPLQDEPIGNATLIPGMVVEANIMTGSKSILRYLLTPIYRSIDRAFAER